MKTKLEGNFIEVNGKQYFPMAYRSFRPAAKTVKNFYEKGIKLFSIFPSGIINALGEPYSQFGEVWVGEGEYNFENLDRQIDMFLENAPDSLFSLMVHLDTRDWFLEKYPECKNSFTTINQSCNFKKWVDEAERFMTDMIAHINEVYPEKMYAVFLFSGYTCEWFSEFGENTLSPTENFINAYKEYTGDSKAALPTMEEVLKTEHGVFRDPIRQENPLNYWKFHNEQVTKMICRMANTVKQQCGCLVGVFYGYLIGLSNGVISRGHNDLKRILNCPDIDLLFAPANYLFRARSSTSGSFIPLESLKLHNKRYYHEIDNTTHLVNNQKQAQILQRSGHRRFNDFHETISYFRRENAFSLAHGQGCWWFDMFSGWYDDEHVMNEIKKIKDINDYMGEKDLSSAAEIAVFTDQTSNYYLNINGDLTYSLVTEQAEELYRLGTPWDSFLADDIANENIGDYKLYIFLNLFNPSDTIIKKITQLREKGKSFLFLYAPGYISDNGFSLESMSSLTGLDFEYSGLDFVDKAVTQDGEEFGFCSQTSPSFTVKGKNTLAVYKGTDIPALVTDEREDSFTAWSGVGAVKASLLKRLAKKAGVFIYSDSTDPVFINKSLFGLYAAKKGDRTIHMPKHAVLKSLYSDEVYSGKSIIIPCNDDEMKLFELSYLPKTEMRNKNTMNIDKLPTVEMLRTINNENRRVFDAVDDCIESIALAVEAAANSFQNNGRLIYVGAGTSGRLGVVDAAECPPTFGAPQGQVMALIAGGDEAMVRAAEGFEDSEAAGRADISRLNLTSNDTVIGISAAGNAAYVVGAMKAARESGSVTVSLTCNEDTKVMEYSDILIVTDTGAEALTGSTRMKAGTAHKLVLNLISTGAMIKTGKVYENLMINVQPSNKKLLDRCIRIICELTGVSYKRAEAELRNADNSIRTAVDNIKGNNVKKSR